MQKKEKQAKREAELERLEEEAKEMADASVEVPTHDDLEKTVQIIMTIIENEKRLEK